MLVLFYPCYSIAQVFETNPDLLRTKNWYFGYGIGMIFDEDSVLIDTTFQGWNYEGTAILSDKHGILKYYSDGKYLYNKNHQIINNTEWLRADNSSCQGVVLIESEKDTGKIHIMTTTPSYSQTRKGYRYSIFDEIGDSFLFINKSIVINIGEKQATINHNNNKGVWITVHSLFNDTFYNFLFQDNHLICCPSINKIGETYKDRFPSQGTLKFAGDGSLCFNMDWNLFNFQIYKFQSEIGELSNLLSIPMVYPYACEYDIRNKELYVVNRGTNLYKYSIKHIDLDSIQNSRETVFSEKAEILGMPQIGLDGSLYISRWMDTALNKIVLSTKDTFKVNLKGKKSLGGLPNFNASYFYTPSIDFAYTEDCWKHAYLFEGRDTFDADGYKWIFQKSGHRDSALTKHCSFQFPDTGKWQVSHIAWNTSRADTVTKTLTLRPKWQQDVLGRDTFYCSGDTQFQLTLKTPPNMHCIHWNGEEPNLDEDLGTIVDYNHFHADSLLVDTAGTYLVKLTNKTFCQLYDTLVVEEKTKPAKPLISFNTGELASTVVADRYNWYLNDTFFLSTSEKSIIPSKSGTYQLVLTSEFGCKSDKSDSFFLSLGVAERSELNQSFLIYPNPSDGVFNLKTDLKDFEVEIYDATGRKIYDQRSVNTFRLEIPGNYLVILKSEKMRSSRVITVK